MGTRPVLSVTFNPIELSISVENNAQGENNQNKDCQSWSGLTWPGQKIETFGDWKVGAATLLQKRQDTASDLTETQLKPT